MGDFAGIADGAGDGFVHGVVAGAALERAEEDSAVGTNTDEDAGLELFPGAEGFFPGAFDGGFDEGEVGGGIGGCGGVTGDGGDALDGLLKPGLHICGAGGRGLWGG